MSLPPIKADAGSVLARLGITTTEAIMMFLNQVVLQQGLPFPLRIPNAETVAALRGAEEHPETLTTYDSDDAMMR